MKASRTMIDLTTNSPYDCSTISVILHRVSATACGTTQYPSTHRHWNIELKIHKAQAITCRKRAKEMRPIRIEYMGQMEAIRWTNKQQLHDYLSYAA